MNFKKQVNNLVDSTNQLSSQDRDDGDEQIFYNPPADIAGSMPVYAPQAEILDKLCFLHHPSSFAVDNNRMAVTWSTGVFSSEVSLGKYSSFEIPSTETRVSSPLRGIVKIVAHFPDSNLAEKGYTVHGSGVLIDEHTVATAGHLVFRNRTHTVKVEVFVGCDRPETRETRDGCNIALHYGWWVSEARRCNDLAFIRLSEPFRETIPINYKQTPILKEDMPVIVYGFPYNMPSWDKGNRLCGSNALLQSMDSYRMGVLMHEGDTAKGNSGGPILNDDGHVVGLHSGWNYGTVASDSDDGSQRTVVINEAILINHLGNDFWALRRVLECLSQGKVEDCDVRVVGRLSSSGCWVFGWNS
ncbi:trypsin-like cysteine/serine peptidase domain-containing protein [Nemania sp. FL0916]|nr:trypsin-like cysteine/serine peptidase domain-containing protein [Nemania sp. FL0916]